MISKLTCTKTFRYATAGSSQSKKLMYVFHGYAQLAPNFIRKFHDLDDYYIVAPEGMHRFYLKGSAGRVGASWMTKEERLDDIEDNCKWLNKLHQKITTENSFDKTIILGFSQGGDTAARWFNDDTKKADHLILWANVFPPDLKAQDLVIRSAKKNVFVLGTDDEYFDKEAQNKAFSFYSDINFWTYSYRGNHDICSDTLNSVLKELK
jgi:predicted esterase